MFFYVIWDEKRDGAHAYYNMNTISGTRNATVLFGSIKVCNS